MKCCPSTVFDSGKLVTFVSTSFFFSGLYYEIQNNDIRMEMAFHEAFKQLQARVLQAQVTRQKSAGTVECVEEGGKAESSLGPWGVTSGSSTAALKVEAPTGRTREMVCGYWKNSWPHEWDLAHKYTVNMYCVHKYTVNSC